MQSFTEISNRNLEKAHEIINELKIKDIWEKHSGKANLVGSVKTNLLMCSLDIDFHVYTENFLIKDSFLRIGEIARSAGIKEVQYMNLLESADRCLEWHLKFLDDDCRTWQIDIIHIRNDSQYAGKFERVADKINRIMNEKLRESILKIKYEAAAKQRIIPGIEVYKAVIEAGIEDYNSFEMWYEENRTDGINEWEPLLNL